jgi:hypothetical protein
MTDEFKGSGRDQIGVLFRRLPEETYGKPRPVARFHGNQSRRTGAHRWNTRDFNFFRLSVPILGGPLVTAACRGLRISRHAANILNKQSRIADKRWSSSCGLRVRPTAPHRKNKLVTKCYKGHRTWTVFLDERPKLKKMDMRFGWDMECEKSEMDLR